MSETFLLTWNPDNWPWPEEDLAHAIAETAAGRVVAGRWSVGIRRQGIEPGDQAFLVRQKYDRGIVARAHFTSPIYEDKHWDGTGKPTVYADLEWDRVVSPDDRLPVDVLKAAVPAVTWDRLQGSGVRVPSGEQDLERTWSEHLNSL